MKKIFSIIVVSLMVCMSFAIGMSVSVQAGDFVEPVGTGMAPSFDPTDLAWNTAGTIAVAVGLGGSLTPVCWFNAETGVWTGITVPMNSQNYRGVDYCPLNDVFWICADAGGPGSIYYWTPGAGGVTSPTPTLNLDLGDVAVDDIGNPLVVGGFA
ncbi:MAG: hypothetical protein KAJ33_02965, partial [Thermoplasmata archaeon]|nr:hypothetical protein [Thermoplasmata archaeon]